jgi:chitinase
VSVCEDTAAPYSCTTDTMQVPDGPCSVRVITIDNAGVSTTGSAYQIVIDNQTPTGTALTAANGGGIAGRIDGGDTIRFTWSEPMAPASILAGWSGAGQAITVHVRNNFSNDEMHFSGSSQVNLVLSSTDLKLGGNFVNADAQYTATMVQSGSSITVTLGTRTGGTVNTVTSSTMTWRPSSLATDLAGRAGATTLVTETSGQDF